MGAGIWGLIFGSRIKDLGPAVWHLLLRVWGLDFLVWAGSSECRGFKLSVHLDDEIRCHHVSKAILGSQATLNSRKSEPEALRRTKAAQHVRNGCFSDQIELCGSRGERLRLSSPVRCLVDQIGGEPQIYAP